MATLQSVKKWDDEADVVILGLGLAGAVTAITAHDLDAHADILIIEKMSKELAGGNSRVSGQTLYAPHDVEKAMRYQRALNEPNPIPEELLRLWAEKMVALEPYMEHMAADSGFEYAKGSVSIIKDFPDMPGSESVEYTATMLPNPSGVWNVFAKQVERRSDRLRFRFETSAIDLVQDPDSLEVHGVIVRAGEQKLAIKARRGVAMCTGGFENNLQMQRDYFGLDYVRTYGTPGNTGDGVRMLQKAGAEMWHLRNRNQSGGFWPGIESPDGKVFMPRNLRILDGAFIDIGKDNRRIANESVDYRMNHWKQLVNGHWVDTPHAHSQPVHMIFDETLRKKYCIAGHTMGWSPLVDKYVWSEDNLAEVEKGWIVKANSIGELAVALDRDPEAVKAEVAKYNQFCADKNDAEFGRNPYCMSPISTAPYYAVRLTPGIVCTTGGAVRDRKSRVISQNGTPIPRLYEVGELGSTIANLYQTGSFLTECMVFGQVAGKELVGLEPQGS